MSQNEAFLAHVAMVFVAPSSDLIIPLLYIKMYIHVIMDTVMYTCKFTYTRFFVLTLCIFHEGIFFNCAGNHINVVLLSWNFFMDEATAERKALSVSCIICPVSRAAVTMEKGYT